MGCASSKPSSSSKSKNKDSINTNGSSSNNKQKSNPKKVANTNNTNSSVDKLEKIKNEQIKIDKNLINQIELYQNKVIDYIVKVVRKELNAELVKNGAGNNNFVAVIQAAAAAQDNDDLITDVASKAIFLIKNGRCNSTYKNLNDSLKSSHFLCKNQTHKTRICELTTETIFICLSTLNESSNTLIDLLNDSESNNGSSVDINNNKQETVNLNKQENQWDNAILLSRSEANEVARMLFYSNRARPIIHASPKAKDAYFVNKQLNENVEVTVDRNEIDEILHTFNQPIFNNFQNQYQYFNDNNQNENNLNLAPVAANKSEPPSSDIRLSNDFESKNLNDKFNQLELENSFQFKEEYDEQRRSNNCNDVQQNDEINTDSLLASLAVISALTSKLDKNDNEERTENLNDDLVLNDSNKKLGNDDSDNFSTDKNTEFKTENDSENEFCDNKDSNSEKNITTTTTAILTFESNNENLNNTNYEDANTTLNSLNYSNNLENQTNNSEDGKLDPILKQSLLDDRYYNNHSFKEEPSVNDPTGNNAATIIQANFKGHTVRQEQVDDKKAEAAAITIQSTYRGYKTRKDIKPKLKTNFNNTNLNHTELEPVKEEDDSKTTLNNNNNNSADNNNTNLDDSNELDHAAIKIQATYRGFKARKDLKKDPKNGKLSQQTNENRTLLNNLINVNELDSDDDTKIEHNRFSSVNSLSSLSNNIEEKDQKNNTLNNSKTDDTDSNKARRIKKFNARKNRKMEQRKKSNKISSDS